MHVPERVNNEDISAYDILKKDSGEIHPNNNKKLFYRNPWLSDKLTNDTGDAIQCADCSTVQYSTVQYSIVQYSIVQYSTVAY